MRQILTQLEELVKQLELGQREKYLPQIKEIRHRLDYPDMKLAVIGNFSCGKSTFLNALLKTSLLTMDTMPTTAVPTYIDWNGKTGKTTVAVTDTKGNQHLLDRKGREWFRHAAGRALPADMGEMLDYLTTTNTLTRVLSKISISFSEKNGYKGFCIVDTPGVNPGDEKAADHILKTQALLREEADTAIVLFPSYCVYTRDFQDFLDQNAKHLLADSIFVVTKMDLVPNEKERDKLIRFVKGRLEQNFALENPNVFGCSAGCALDYYTGHAEAGNSWTDSFEQMLGNIFQELSERRKRIVTEKTKKMLGNLIGELQTEIKERQDALLKTRQDFTVYSYENLEKEYRSGLQPYRKAIQSAADKERDSMKNFIRNKSEEITQELEDEANSAKNADELQDLMEITFPEKIKQIGKEIEDRTLVSMKLLNEEINGKYKGLMTAMQNLLERYQYNIGEFETFADGRKKEKGKASAIRQANAGAPVNPSDLTDWRGIAAALSFGAFAAFGIGGALVGWALYRFVLSKQKEKAIAQISESMANYEKEATRYYSENVRLLSEQYNQAGENLLMEYTQEYKAYFEEKERKLEAYKADVEKQIGKNEQRIAAMDEMSQFILCGAVNNGEEASTERTILFLGGFCVGKSTLINAMLREEVVPTGYLPSSSMITRISYGEDQRLRICWQDGMAEEILSREEWQREVEKSDSEYPMNDTKEVYLYSRNVPKGICMVDTPGDAYGSVTVCRIIPTSDIIVFVMNVTQALNKLEKEWIKSILYEIGYNNKEKIWFVFNGMNLLDRQNVAKFKKWVYCSLSFVYEDENGCYDKTLYSRRVFFISAGNAYDIRRGNKSSMTEEETGVPALERSLESYMDCGK